MNICVNIKQPKLGIDFGNPIVREVVSGEIYNGIVEVTPSNETIILGTNNKYVLSDITINPIPKNYGLVTWNGAFLSIT